MLIEKLYSNCSCGRQDCSDMHSWGPGSRNTNIVHYIIRGRGFVEYEKKKYTVETGQSFFIRPFQLVHYWPDPNDPWEYVWLEFHDPESEKLLRQICSESSVIGQISTEEIMPYFDLLLKSFKNPKSQLSFDGLGYALLGFYVDRFSDNNLRASKERLNYALKYIRDNYYRTAFHLDELCNKMSISSVTLFRLFKTETGISPGDYLTKYRMEQAIKMLSTSLTVKDIALSCGYSDPLYFSKSFKKFTGVSPKIYRAENILSLPK